MSSRWLYSVIQLALQVLSPADRLGDLGIARILLQPRCAWAICWLVMPPCASCEAMNISASSFCCWPSAGRFRGIDVQAGGHQLRRGARLQRAQRHHRAMAKRQRVGGAASVHQFAVHSADRSPPAASTLAAPGRTPPSNSAGRPAPGESWPCAAEVSAVVRNSRGVERSAATVRCPARGRWPTAAERRLPPACRARAAPRRDCGVPRSARAAPTAPAGR